MSHEGPIPRCKGPWGKEYPTADMAGWKSPHLHKPELVIYDLPRPYERHWNFLRLLKETDSLKAAVGAS